MKIADLMVREAENIVDPRLLANPCGCRGRGSGIPSFYLVYLSRHRESMALLPAIEMPFFSACWFFSVHPRLVCKSDK
ncbi:hypothetical protein CEXT_373631 [Caerostris extrusa]|uniref:Uncharacterized protein n=1 Tax=Caerostris extrusa TaxID=172846 RepID=A0AAV4QUI1_CAEEX|nr:hypothetical protein CEXT_373631 [Caerostris extrusa]